MSGRSAIASLPAGTAASRSSTTSSGVSSSSASRGREQEDLRVDAVERLLELLLVAHLDGAVEPELERAPVQLLEPAVVVVERVEDEQIRVGATRDASSSGTSARQRIGSDVASRTARGIAAHDERLGALRLGGSGGVGDPRPPR